MSPGHDEFGLAIQTNEGCYSIASQSPGGIGGYKTQAAWNSSNDYWIVKFCDSIQLAAVFTAPHHVCPGSCIAFANLSINATSYEWFFPGATPLTSTDINPANICYSTPGNYDVQLIATNAYGSDTIILMNYITVYSFPSPQGITQSGDTLFAYQGATSYQWYFNGIIINGATDYFYVAQASGDYNLVATDANGCEVEAVIFNVIASVQISVGNGQLAIYPNPVGDQLTIQNALPIAIGSTIKTAIMISVYNMIGEMILAVNLPIAYSKLPTYSIDVSKLTPGLYSIEIAAGEKIFRNKFVTSTYR